MKILLVLLLLLSGCSYSFKTFKVSSQGSPESSDEYDTAQANRPLNSIPVNEEILIEEMESIDRLEQIKIEMDKRLKELKDE
jgi:hypothetical protein